MPRPLIVLPTYNEAENIAEILRRVRAATPQAGVLVVDDSSPDGTADVARAMAAEVGDVEILSRPRKSGLGSAYREGFKWGRQRGFEVLVEMDSDFSHDPADIPRLLNGVEDGADLVIGSNNWAGKAAFKALDHFLVYLANNTSVDVAKTSKAMGLPDLEVPRSLSPIERPFLEAWNKGVKRGWPALARQHQVVTGERRYRLDFAIPSEKIAIELDGHRWHSSPEQMASDRERQTALEALGWHFLRFTGQEVYRDVDHCVARVRDLIANLNSGGCRRLDPL